MQDGKSTSDAVKKKGLSNQAVILIIVIGILICGTVIAVVLLLGREEPQPAVTGRNPILTADNYLEIQQEVADRVDKSMFETYMNTTWRFPDGESASSNAVMGNSDANNFPFYFTVTLEGETEPIFTSGLLPLGTRIGEIVLDRDLEQGTYPAVVHIHMVDDDGVLLEGNMGFNIALEIES